MANPADPGTFENWITNRIEFGNTRGTVLVGSFESWITARIYYDTYPDQAEQPTPPTPTPTPELVCAAPEIQEPFNILEDDDEWLIIYHSSRLMP